MQLFLLFCLFFALALQPGHAAAFEPVPFATRNLNPLVQIHGLPIPKGGRVMAPGETALLLNYNLASHFARKRRGEELIFLDGETHRLELHLRRGLRPGLEVGVEIPWIRHSGGFLDNFIDGWHDLTGLPGGGRGRVPRNQILFAYRHEDEVVRFLDESAAGLGDVRLTAGWLLPWGEDSDSMALRAGLKLPTGDSDRLTGSGAAAFSLALDGRRDSGAWSWFGSGGTLLMARGDILPERQRRLVGFGSLGTAWKPLERLALKIQLDGHTSFYDSSLTPLGPSLQLVLGGTVAFSEHTTLELAIVEDLVVYSAPDVVFHLALHTRF